MLVESQGDAVSASLAEKSLTEQDCLALLHQFPFAALLARAFASQCMPAARPLEVPGPAL